MLCCDGVDDFFEHILVFFVTLYFQYSTLLTKKQYLFGRMLLLVLELSVFWPYDARYVQSLATTCRHDRQLAEPSRLPRD